MSSTEFVSFLNEEEKGSFFYNPSESSRILLGENQYSDGNFLTGQLENNNPKGGSYGGFNQKVNDIQTHKQPSNNQREQQIQNYKRQDSGTAQKNKTLGSFENETTDNLYPATHVIL